LAAPRERAESKNQEIVRALNELDAELIAADTLRLVKEVRASLFLKWIRNNFPNVPILYMFRHPCAVVHSWAKLGWGDDDIESLLSQDALITDYLEGYVSMIRKASTMVFNNEKRWPYRKGRRRQNQKAP
jgi:hypothetical protein